MASAASEAFWRVIRCVVSSLMVPILVSLLPVALYAPAYPSCLEENAISIGQHDFVFIIMCSQKSAQEVLLILFHMSSMALE